jgi:hypothetical protein
MDGEHMCLKTFEILSRDFKLSMVGKQLLNDIGTKFAEQIKWKQCLEGFASSFSAQTCAITVPYKGEIKVKLLSNPAESSNKRQIPWKSPETSQLN